MARERRGGPELDRWGRDLADSSQRGLYAALYRSWFRVEWEGLENVPREGGALLVANHAGMMPVDGQCIQIGIEEQLGRRVYLLAHHTFFQLPFMGRFMNRAGTVCANPDNAHRLLREDGQLVNVFPEGNKGPTKPPSQRYRLQRFGRGGFVETAMRAGVPVVPLVLMGTDDTSRTLTNFPFAGENLPVTANMLLLGPLGVFVPLPAKIRIRVLPPVHFDEEPELPAYPRSLLMDRAEAIRSDMQDALDELHAARESVWFG